MSNDPALQTTTGPLVGTTAGLDFAGVGNGDYGFTPNAAPPDTNGAVGATQYVQWVNESFAVFNKANGALVFGPVAGNTLWGGFGGGCQTNNDGDPIVQYDKIANRWVMTQFSVSTKPYLQCVAVSTTSDATGTYNRYAFSYGTVQFNDYPKLGVWPDAYYVSFNIFNNGTTFAGSKACAYDRASMLAGGTATQVCFQLSSSFGGLLPSDLDGASASLQSGGLALPPAGSPNYFLNLGSNSLNLWNFHVDFATPANSTFIGPTNMPVAAFAPACNGGTCIPQPSTRQKLDSLADRLMYRLAYRHFADGHESLVVNHSVTAGSSVGVRWYEIRSPNTTPTVFQQGTYAPDATYRWMGSIAMDQQGDIALGYSASSSTVRPSIRYTGRLASDAPNIMQAENSIQVGGGSQLRNLSRWGDYSGMTVDPVDDCTFWYTNEYLKSSGTFNWSTQIASFYFPSCVGLAPPPTATSVSPTSGSAAGGTAVTISGSGFVATPTVSIGGSPATSVVWVSATSLTAVTPAHSAGAVTVVVTNPDTQTGSCVGCFTYLSGATVYAQDSFTRGDTTSGWGTADAGGAWTHRLSDGTDASSLATISSNAGKVSLTTGRSTLDERNLVGPSVSDVDITASFRVDAASGVSCALIGRASDYNHFYASRLSFATNTLSIWRNNGGSWTQLVSVTTPTLQLNVAYNVRFQLQGTALRSRYWVATDPEPTAWSLQTSDATFASGQVGIRAALGATSSSANLFFDDFIATSVP